jgi:NAD-dependent SIR2 family protein deacetylase
MLEDADVVLVLAGAGMSAELGTPTYWTGDQAGYGDTRTKHGYTNLEHASAPLWDVAPLQQAEFFAEQYATMSSMPPVDPSADPYLLLLDWLTANSKEHFAVTSNVDQAFTRAGFMAENVLEIHGAYDRSQCLMQPMRHGIFPSAAPGSGMSTCPSCGTLARPNVLFFADFDFNGAFRQVQLDAFSTFVRDREADEVVILEVGVGTTVMNLRNMSGGLHAHYDFPLIRVNPHHVKQGDHLSESAPINEHQMAATEGILALTM